MSDFDVSAEFAAMFLATGPGLPAGVPRALDGIVAGLPLVDLGAGTGLATVALADAFPGTGIVAVEPSRAQRTALMTRLAGRPDLHARVTVVPADAFTADLPPRWGGAVAIHLLCQLPPPTRPARTSPGSATRTAYCTPDRSFRSRSSSGRCPWCADRSCWPRRPRPA